MSDALEALAAEASGCTACGLAKTRTTVVFGSGDPLADLMFIGEAPGFHEDRQGEPFVGAAGGLLTTLLRGIGLEREQVYIANVLKCRPPGNRDPEPDEIDSCKPYLKQQIALVDPRVICTLGNFSTHLLLGRKVGITRVRGQRIDWRGRSLVPTFHPAAVLRGGPRGNAMAQIEDDFRAIAKILDEVPAAGPPERAVAPGAAPGSHPGGEAEQLGLF